MNRRIPLAYQILLYQVAIVVLAAGVGVVVALYQARAQLDSEYEQRALAIAETVASNSQVRAAVAAGDPSGAVQAEAESVRRQTGATYVVVTDAAGIRFSHPNPARIGQPVDEAPGEVLRGHTWVGVQRGTLGVSARGKAPIFADGRVVGMVSVGFLETQVVAQLLAELPGYGVTVLLVLAMGAGGSWLLARHLKRQTLGLEPAEIAALLEEREASLAGIGAGALATDRDGRVTFANDEARSLLGLPAECVGQRIGSLLPTGRLQRFVLGELQDEDEIVLAGQRALAATRRPLMVNGRLLGHVATFRDAREMARLRSAFEVDSLSDALRAQAHEFNNRLHTVAGLIELGRPEEAMRLIAQTSVAHQDLSESLLDRLGDPVLGAVLLAKAATCSERGVDFRVGEETVLSRHGIDHEDLITILGNLIDNAVDAALAGPPPRWVEVSVADDAGTVLIEVRDSGAGVPDGLSGEIFHEGFTTKPKQGARRRGFGLALVEQAVARNGGEVAVENRPGAAFTVRLPAENAPRLPVAG